MYKLRVKDKEFTIPKENIKLFALYEALQRGIKKGNIHDNPTAIEYLDSIGIKVSEMAEVK